VTALDKLLRQQPCMVSMRRPVTLHHCRGGSMMLTPWGTPGGGHKQNEALKIPIHFKYHVGTERIDGAINGGVQTWEARWGNQKDLLNQLSRNLGFCLWRLAWEWTPWKLRQPMISRIRRDLS
jgi:hypothetical protein